MLSLKGGLVTFPTAKKIGLLTCGGPLLQTNISSGARTDRYLQNNNPGAYADGKNTVFTGGNFRNRRDNIVQKLRRELLGQKPR